jgi:hypothetical protein
MIPLKCEPVYCAGTQRLQRSKYCSELSGFGAGRLTWPAFVQKLIRAAHAKEKQLPEELVQPPESP